MSKRILCKPWMAVACAAGLWLGAGAAQAHGSNVYWSLGVGGPGVQVAVGSAPPVVTYPAVVAYPPVLAYPPVVMAPPRPVAYVPAAYYGPPPGWRHHHHHGGREHGHGGWYR